MTACIGDEKGGENAKKRTVQKKCFVSDIKKVVFLLSINQSEDEL